MQNIKLIIGDKNYSFWSLCPWLMLNMFNVKFEEIQIRLYQSNTAEKLGPYSPSLKVPVLLHNDVTIWDSLSICEYISGEVLPDSGWPKSPKRRATARSVSAEIHADFSEIKKHWPMNCSATFKPFARDKLLNEVARIDAIFSCCRHRYGENGLYLFGRFSIADCLYAPMAICLHNHRAVLSDESRLYVNTLLANPFIQRWLAQARAELQPHCLPEVGNF
ncbi:MAG: glutathione S-transferase [SAR86 cluster bacterium]|uniref:Glutathione S-transferase n=1 Tax=SAR86 cluster bacterium TaxID=2030880 RepID=A0A2A4MU48_9GAMM|nr:MAG: glutathione S-transferase [SAR86 cluster bacterium]